MSVLLEQGQRLKVGDWLNSPKTKCGLRELALDRTRVNNYTSTRVPAALASARTPPTRIQIVLDNIVRG